MNFMENSKAYLGGQLELTKQYPIQTGIVVGVVAYAGGKLRVDEKVDNMLDNVKSYVDASGDQMANRRAKEQLEKDNLEIQKKILMEELKTSQDVNKKAQAANKTA